MRHYLNLNWIKYKKDWHKVEIKDCHEIEMFLISDDLLLITL